MSDTVEVNSCGKTFIVGKAGAGAEMRNIRLLSGNPGLTASAPYMAMAKVLGAVVSIDGVPVPKPTTAEHFERTADLVGDALADVSAAFMKLNGMDIPASDGIEEAKN